MRLLPEEISSIVEEHDFAADQVERMIRLFDVLETFAGHEVLVHAWLWLSARC